MGVFVPVFVRHLKYCQSPTSEDSMLNRAHLCSTQRGEVTLETIQVCGCRSHALPLHDVKATCGVPFPNKGRVQRVDIAGVEDVQRESKVRETGRGSRRER